ncbi:MAG: hypothetical protein KGQ86_04135 [Bacteroidetes bacterium]|nr:hypothetical protein [Bacteroidota bacterium]
MMPKSWTEKLNVNKDPKVIRMEESFSDIPADSMMLVATPALVDDYIRKIPKGKMVDMKTLRKDLAADFHADNSCPLSTAIFVRIAAEAAFEQFISGRKLEEITPFWRVIQPGSKMASKLTFGEDFLKKQIKAELA